MEERSPTRRRLVTTAALGYLSDSRLRGSGSDREENPTSGMFSLSRSDSPALTEGNMSHDTRRRSGRIRVSVPAAGWPVAWLLLTDVSRRRGAGSSPDSRDERSR
ncbi:hypothetical protein EYF80_063460 [Liparis tanakae]|uniref:Uncharacterized protein n=1 Tax=Liparis tanakae TaxID=230148 RepID=A0A4Z2EDP5_9TELE|nr:hypothetical protein EYF80_063460 [Liparis tanakae]